MLPSLNRQKCTAQDAPQAHTRVMFASQAVQTVSPIWSQALGTFVLASSTCSQPIESHTTQRAAVGSELNLFEEANRL